MRELLLVSSHIVCAFISVMLATKFFRHGRPSTGVFWFVWAIALVGSFVGGWAGAWVFAHGGITQYSIINAIPSILVAWTLAATFLWLRRLPDNW
ncbi:MAG: hypothetical protein MI717_15005 [Spirochaetales bacterium]|nr:hypothetical protein [Spirochaetales bacterium]